MVQPLSLGLRLMIMPPIRELALGPRESPSPWRRIAREFPRRPVSSNRSSANLLNLILVGSGEWPGSLTPAASNALLHLFILRLEGFKGRLAGGFIFDGLDRFAAWLARTLRSPGKYFNSVAARFSRSACSRSAWSLAVFFRSLSWDFANRRMTSPWDFKISSPSVVV